MRNLPRTTAPASIRRSTTAGAASSGGSEIEWDIRPWHAGAPLPANFSSTATGTPCRAPSGRPCWRSTSVSRARPSAPSRSISTHPRNAASVPSMRSRHAATSASDVSAPARIRAAASSAGRSGLACSDRFMGPGGGPVGNGGRPGPARSRAAKAAHGVPARWRPAGNDVPPQGM